MDTSECGGDLECGHDMCVKNGKRNSYKVWFMESLMARASLTGMAREEDFIAVTVVAKTKKNR